jgi:hypothetical protein
MLRLFGKLRPGVEQLRGRSVFMPNSPDASAEANDI